LSNLVQNIIFCKISISTLSYELSSLENIEVWFNQQLKRFKRESKSSSNLKRPLSSNFYADIFKYKINEFADSVTLSPDDVAHNLLQDAFKNCIKAPKIQNSPEEYARKYVNKKCWLAQDELHVMKVAREYLA